MPTPHGTAVLVIVGALLFVLCCSRIPLVGPIVVVGVAVGVLAGVAGTALAHGLV